VQQVQKKIQGNSCTRINSIKTTCTLQLGFLTEKSVQNFKASKFNLVQNPSTVFLSDPVAVYNLHRPFGTTINDKQIKQLTQKGTKISPSNNCTQDYHCTAKNLQNLTTLYKTITLNLNVSKICMTSNDRYYATITHTQTQHSTYIKQKITFCKKSHRTEGAQCLPNKFLPLPRLM